MHIWRRISSLLAFLVILGIAYVISPTALAGIDIVSIEYPEPPETVTMDESVPIFVTVSYTDLSDSMWDCIIVPDPDYPPPPSPWTAGGNGHNLSSTGFYQFPPVGIQPARSEPTGGWPEFINEWHLTAVVGLYGTTYDVRQDFTILVENPNRKQSIEIKSVEYVVPPDTIAVYEPSLVKINFVYQNLTSRNSVEAVIYDQGKRVASESRPVRPGSKLHPGSSEATFEVVITPKRVGSWNLWVELNVLSSGSVLWADKEVFQIEVVPR